MMSVLRNLLVVICTAALAATTALASVNLPDFGEPADRTLSPAEEADIGARIEAQLHAAGLILEDLSLIHI